MNFRESSNTQEPARGCLSSPTPFHSFSHTLLPYHLSLSKHRVDEFCKLILEFTTSFRKALEFKLKQQKADEKAAEKASAAAEKKAEKERKKAARAEKAALKRAEALEKNE
tara:strand:- start:219 stop:551 length:333 start_codon:yes stop_codon:yes gene_type:complete